MLLCLARWCFALALVLFVTAHVHAHDLRVYEPQPPPPQPQLYVGGTAQPTNVQQVNVHEHHHVYPPARDVSVSDGSVLAYSLEGFVAGALVGLSAGYLVTKGDPWDSAWRGSVLATGIGALSAAGLGVGLGLLDASLTQRPLRFIMRDALCGTLLGGLFGAVVGGLVVLSSRDGHDVLVGTAIGGISGFVLGGLTGVLEGQLRPRVVQFGLGSAQDARGKQSPFASLNGRF